MSKFIVPVIAGIALSTPAIAQQIPVVLVDAYHVRIGDLTDDIRTGPSDDWTVLRGPSPAGQELVRQVIAAGCLRPDEADLSRRDCYINHDEIEVHRPARDNNGRPQGATALCRDGTYSFSQHHDGTCSHHGGVERWEERPRANGGGRVYTPGEIDCYRDAQQGIYNPACSAAQPNAQ